MVFFPDRRKRYEGKASFDFQPGAPRGDNPVKVSDAKTEIATRAPLGAFRVSTTTDPVLLQQQAEDAALAARKAAEDQKGKWSSQIGSVKSGSSDDMSLDADGYNFSNSSLETSTLPAGPASGSNGLTSTVSTNGPASIDSVMGG